MGKFLILIVIFLLTGILFSHSLVLANDSDTNSGNNSGPSENSGSSNDEERFESEIRIGEDDGNDSFFRERVRTRIREGENGSIEREFRKEVSTLDGTKITIERKVEVKDGEIKIKIVRKVRSINGTIKEVTIIIEKIRDDEKEIRIEGMNFSRVKTELEIDDDFENNESELKVVMSNGNKTKIKILPDRASEIARERLKARNISNMSLEEIRHRNIPRVVYNIEANKNGRFLGVFKLAMKVSTEIDPETGDVITLSKPWWAFLVTGEDSDQTGDVGAEMPVPGDEEGNETEVVEGNETTNETT